LGCEETEEGIILLGRELRRHLLRHLLLNGAAQWDDVIRPIRPDDIFG
jgi:hypothetical protein